MPLTRRDFLIGAGAAVTLLERVPRAWGAEAARQGRPNLLLIQTDDHWYRALGCMGLEAIQTPHIDRLAERGLCFERTICQGAECVPSRASLLTGSYPHNNGVYSNHCDPMAPGHWSFPAALRRAGYESALIGKDHVRVRRAGRIEDQTDPAVRADFERFGFDEIRSFRGKLVSAWGSKYGDPYREYLREKGLLQKHLAYHRGRKPMDLDPSPLDEEHVLDAVIGRSARDWLGTAPKDRPFFLWLNFASPHFPCDAPLPYATMYDPAEMPAPIPPSPDQLPPMLRRRVLLSPRLRDPAFVRRVRAAYFGMITLVDVWVGRLVEKLEALGRRDDTVIVFCADQGDMLGDHGLFAKGVFWKSAIQSPLVISWPARFRQKARVRDLVELQDLVPTFLELAGAEEADRRQPFGRSLVPLLTGKASHDRDAAFAEKRSVKMIETDAWKYVYKPATTSRMLFHLSEDPDETRNLAGQASRAGQERELRDRLLDWLASTYEHPHSAPARRAPG